jgi:hypothetical protein
MKQQITHQLLHLQTPIFVQSVQKTAQFVERRKIIVLLTTAHTRLCVCRQIKF